MIRQKNYRIAYEEAILIAKRNKCESRSDFFPYIFALDIRGEEADDFISKVLA
jgi:hypothetical protein